MGDHCCGDSSSSSVDMLKKLQEMLNAEAKEEEEESNRWFDEYNNRLERRGEEADFAEVIQLQNWLRSNLPNNGFTATKENDECYEKESLEGDDDKDICEEEDVGDVKKDVSLESVLGDNKVTGLEDAIEANAHVSSEEVAVAKNVSFVESEVVGYKKVTFEEQEIIDNRNINSSGEVLVDVSSGEVAVDVNDMCCEEETVDVNGVSLTEVAIEVADVRSLQEVVFDVAEFHTAVDEQLECFEDQHNDDAFVADDDSNINIDLMNEVSQFKNELESIIAQEKLMDDKQNETQNKDKYEKEIDEVTNVKSNSELDVRDNIVMCNGDNISTIDEDLDTDVGDNKCDAEASIKSYNVNGVVFVPAEVVNIESDRELDEGNNADMDNGDSISTNDEDVDTDVGDNKCDAGALMKLYNVNGGVFIPDEVVEVDDGDGSDVEENNIDYGGNKYYIGDCYYNVGDNNCDVGEDLDISDGSVKADNQDGMKSDRIKSQENNDTISFIDKQKGSTNRLNENKIMEMSTELSLSKNSLEITTENNSIKIKNYENGENESDVLSSIKINKQDEEGQELTNKGSGNGNEINEDEIMAPMSDVKDVVIGKDESSSISYKEDEIQQITKTKRRYYVDRFKNSNELITQQYQKYDEGIYRTEEYDDNDGAGPSSYVYKSLSNLSLMEEKHEPEEVYWHFARDEPDIPGQKDEQFLRKHQKAMIIAKSRGKSGIIRYEGNDQDDKEEEINRFKKFKNQIKKIFKCHSDVEETKTFTTQQIIEMAHDKIEKMTSSLDDNCKNLDSVFESMSYVGEDVSRYMDYIREELEKNRSNIISGIMIIELERTDLDR